MASSRLVTSQELVDLHNMSWNEISMLVVQGVFPTSNMYFYTHGKAGGYAHQFFNEAFPREYVEAYLAERALRDAPPDTTQAQKDALLSEYASRLRGGL